MMTTTMATTTVGDRGGVQGAVEDSIKRVDRVARQIYICNDQLRQMEIMKRGHELGVLFWALHQDRHHQDKEQEGEGGEEEDEEDGLAYLYSREEDITTPVDIELDLDIEEQNERYRPYLHDRESEVEVDLVDSTFTSVDMGIHRRERESESVVPVPVSISVPEIHLTRATIYDPDPDPIAEEEEVCEYLVTPAQESESETVSESRIESHSHTKVSYADADAEVSCFKTPEGERPLSTLSTMSTISISLSPISLGFPLPPSRPWPSFDQLESDTITDKHMETETERTSSRKDAVHLDSLSLFPKSRGSLRVSYNSIPTPTSSSHCSSLGVHGNSSSSSARITIYPPSHDHPAPPNRMSEMPHTPLISEYSHEAPTPDSSGNGETGQEGEGEGEGDDRPLPPLPPLRTRRSKPDIGIYIPTIQDIPLTEKRFRQVTIPRSKSRSRNGNGVTSPLRLVRDSGVGMGMGKGKGKYQSKSLSYQSEFGYGGERRTKIIRESGYQGVSPPRYRTINTTTVPHHHICPGLPSCRCLISDART